MIGKEVIESAPVTLATVKTILKKRSKDEGEMVYEQKIALEHAEKFGRIKQQDSDKLMGEIKELGIRLTDDTIVKLIDVLPEDETAVKAVLMQSGTQLKKEQAQKILDLIAKYKSV